MSISVGDRLAGRTVSAVIDSVPFSFERRRYGGAAGTTFTWAHAYLGDKWHSLGDPWPVLRPKSNELLASVDQHLGAIKAAEPDKSRVLVGLREVRTGIEHYRELGTTSEFNQRPAGYKEQFIRNWIAERGTAQHGVELEFRDWQYLTPAQWKNFYDEQQAGTAPRPSPAP